MPREAKLFAASAGSAIRGAIDLHAKCPHGFGAQGALRRRRVRQKNFFSLIGLGIASESGGASIGVIMPTQSLVSTGKLGLPACVLRSIGSLVSGSGFS